MTDTNLLRIATLLDDLKHDDLQVRVNSMKHLKEITAALGPERTRNELIPFLADTVMDDEDEVLVVAAEEFGQLVAEVGGAAHIPSLLRALEELAKVDEPKVREEAVKSISSLVPQMKKDDVTKFLVPLIKNLASNPWFTAYPYVSNDVKAELRGIFGILCKDDTPTVRKAAAHNIGKFAETIGDYSIAKEELFPLFQILAQDPQDSVKLYAAKNIISFAKIAPSKEEKQEIWKEVFNLASDPAWRVKYTVADNFLELTTIAVKAGLDKYYGRLITLYISLLHDDEPEVRAMAVKKLVDVGKAFKSSSAANQFCEQILAVLEKIVDDQSDFVRTELGSVILGMAPIVESKKAIANLVPLFLRLLKDAESQVRLNLIGNLDLLESTISIEYLTDELIPSIEELAGDNEWRVKLAIIKHLPLVARHVGQKVFDDKLIEHCIKWLGDEVFSIREAATENLRELTELFGEEWAKEQLFDNIKKQAHDKGYLLRMQALRSIESLAPVVSSETLNTDLMAHIVHLSKDPIPNIKFNVAKCIEKIADKLTPGVLEHDVKPMLKALENDADADVKFFAQRASVLVKQILDDKA